MLQKVVNSLPFHAALLLGMGALETTSNAAQYGNEAFAYATDRYDVAQLPSAQLPSAQLPSAQLPPAQLPPALSTPGNLPPLPAAADQQAAPGIAGPQNRAGQAPATRPTSPQPPSPVANAQPGDAAPRTQVAQSSGLSGFQPSSQLFARMTFTIGDFFGRASSPAAVGQLVGVGAHHTVSSGSAFAADDIHLVAFSTAQSKYAFSDISGATPGSFFTKTDLSPITPPAPDVIPELSGNSVAGKSYTAVVNGDQADIYDNPANVAPSIPNADLYNVFEVMTIALPGPNVADLVGRARIQDNNAAVPRDRMFLDYSYFHNVPLTRPPIDVNRFMPGFEKTFFDEMASVEVRLPMSFTVDSDVEIRAPLDTSHYEFGNLTLITKLLLASYNDLYIAGGMGVAVPTADNLLVASADGTPLLKVTNDSVHLIPFLAYLYAPQRSSFFSHGFLTLDVDTNGSTTSANVTGEGLRKIGVWNDQHLITASGSIGQWIYEDDRAQTGVTGVAWTTELHYTASVNDADRLTSGAFSIGDPSADLSLLNATVGGHLRLPNGTVTAGYSAPLTSSDRVFDGELRVFVNRFF